MGRNFGISDHWRWICAPQKKKHSGEETERNLLNEYKCRSTQPCPGEGLVEGDHCRPPVWDTSIPRGCSGRSAHGTAYAWSLTSTSKHISSVRQRRVVSLPGNSVCLSMPSLPAPAATDLRTVWSCASSGKSQACEAQTLWARACSLFGLASFTQQDCIESSSVSFYGLIAVSFCHCCAFFNIALKYNRNYRNSLSAFSAVALNPCTPRHGCHTAGL